jgi:hypothetical protein
MPLCKEPSKDSVNGSANNHGNDTGLKLNTEAAAISRGIGLTVL